MILLTADTNPYDIAQALSVGFGFNTEQIPLEEVKVLCAPSGGTLNVILPLTTYGSSVQNMKILVAQIDGNTGGKVTVNAATPSGGTQEIIEADGSTTHDLPAGGYGSTIFEVVRGSNVTPPLFTGQWVGRDSD